jgi:MbtH protein
MSNPFEDDQALFHVLQNDEGQYSLFPAALQSPEGWLTRFGPESRANCLAFVEANWTDMRPRSLVKAMEQSAR